MRGEGRVVRVATLGLGDRGRYGCKGKSDVGFRISDIGPGVTGVAYGGRERICEAVKRVECGAESIHGGGERVEHGGERIHRDGESIQRGEACVRPGGLRAVRGFESTERDREGISRASELC